MSDFLSHSDNHSERLPGHDYSPFDSKPDKPLLKWPPGYWEQYETLRQRARKLCEDPHANIIVLRNGYFEVRFKNDDGEEVHGPQEPDRLTALTQFIAHFANQQ